MIKRLALVLSGVLLAVVGLGATSTMGFSPFKLGQTDRSQPALLLSIQEASRYTAATGKFEVVLDVEHDATWMPDFVDGRRTLFVAAGTVDAYVDLSGLGDEDVVLSADGESATIRLPMPELEKPNLDSERSYVFSQDRGVLERISDAIDTPQQAEFYQLAETKLTAAAEESELRSQADENTRTMLTGLCSTLGLDVTFVDSATD